MISVGQNMLYGVAASSGSVGSSAPLAPTPAFDDVVGADLGLQPGIGDAFVPDSELPLDLSAPGLRLPQFGMPRSMLLYAIPDDSDSPPPGDSGGPGGVDGSGGGRSGADRLMPHSLHFTTNSFVAYASPRYFETEDWELPRIGAGTEGPRAIVGSLDRFLRERAKKSTAPMGERDVPNLLDGLSRLLIQAREKQEEGKWRSSEWILRDTSMLAARALRTLDFLHPESDDYMTLLDTAEISLRMGFVAKTWLRKHDEAREILRHLHTTVRRQTNIAFETGNPIEALFQLHRHSKLFRNRGHTAQARELWMEMLRFSDGALRNARRSQNEADKFNLLCWRAIAHTRMGCLDGAVKSCNSAIRVARRSENIQWQLQAIQLRGVIQQGIGNL